MIHLENVGDGRLRFATKNPTAIEVMLIDGKMFVHSEPLTAARATPPIVNRKPDEKELDFLKDTKTS